MGIFAIEFRFPGEPPAAETINEWLRGRVGEWCALSGYRREGNELHIRVGLDVVSLSYTRKVLRDLGGTELDYFTREPLDEALPTFVDKPWHEHDEATKLAIHEAFQRELSADSEPA